MQYIKDSQRAQVARNFTGSFTKVFTGPNKEQRFKNEVRVLQFLNSQGCPFVPSLIAHDSHTLSVTTSYAGEPVQRISDQRLSEVFEELANYGVRHDDQAQRNVLYNHSLGRFTVIDFEFAEVLADNYLDSFADIDDQFERLEAALEVASV